MKRANAFPKRPKTIEEEIANAASHGLGFFVAIAAVPSLLKTASRDGDSLFIAGVCVFSASVLLMYFSSSVYHALPAGKAKSRFLLLDHAAIYFLIAGTYTPFTLGVMRDSSGWSILGAVWALAFLGLYLMSDGKNPHPFLNTSLYLAMGWLVLIALEPLVSNVPRQGIAWILAGGLFYTAGVVFYATSSRIRFGHLVWHLFVMAGTACHYFAVLWYAA